MIYDDISQTIGRTPVVRINRLAPKHVTSYVKLEPANPGGSVKDRLALGIIQDAERRELLKPGATVVEATSGNTGIALALVCASRGYRFVAVMPESFSVERRQIMRAYGAKVILTPAADRAGDPLRLRGAAPRLLGHRVRHGRHVDRRGADDQARAPGDKDRDLRARRCRAAGRQGVEAPQDPRLDARLRALGS